MSATLAALVCAQTDEEFSNTETAKKLSKDRQAALKAKEKAEKKLMEVLED